MSSWKAVVIALATLIVAKAEAAEYVYISSYATVLGSEISSKKIADLFTPARDDALAFIASDGDIRGAQFEQIVQYYHSTASQPKMSDLQLAQAIAANY